VDWVKLSTNYYDDPAVMRAGEAAEVLFTRAMAYCGDQETDGVVPAEVLPRLTPTRGVARARALVREGLWEEIPGGWRFSSWDHHQTSREALERDRQANRRRQAIHRARRRPPISSVVNGVRNGVTNGEVTPTEVEVEVEDAAAAASSTGAAEAAWSPSSAFSPVVDVLRSRMQAHTALAALRFDTLTPEQVGQVEELVAVHGDQRLVDVALSTCRTPPPVHVTAFLGTWRALPPPGQVLRDVTRQELCDVHGTVLSAAGRCAGCRADEIAAAP
jgi:hypothetical protein